MSLRQRIVLTLAVIAAILVIPAAYGYFSLRELSNITTDLRERDTGATQALGELRKTLEEMNRTQSGLAAVIGDSVLEQPSRESWRVLEARIEGMIAELSTRRGASSQYRQAVQRTKERWELLTRYMREEQSRVERKVSDKDAVYRTTVVEPASAAVEATLDEVARAIAREGEVKVERAQEVSRQAGTTTLLALALALGLTVVVGLVLTRSLLRPIEELRRGMAHVAEGDFEPHVRVPKERPDELGDLARSFGTMTEQLAELDRLKAEFVSVASHEIKTPLSVIRGYVSLLADGIYGAVNEAQQKTLSSVSDQVDRLTRLVHRLLDISRFEAGGGRLEVRRINLRDFADELTDGFRVLAMQNGIDFEVRITDDVPVNIEGDADRLNEVLGNLLSNAFKFTPKGGTIRMLACRNGTGVVVEVEDTGVGIPPEKLPKIFEKFYQVENDAQPRSVGSGLGLAIAREIVEAHGGTIGAESRVGEGTKFTVTLPERPPVHRMPDPHPTQERR